VSETCAREWPRIGLPMYTLQGSPHGWGISAAYVQAVDRAGGLAIPVPLLADHPFLDRCLASLDGLLLCGGGDVSPARYAGHDTGHSRGIDQERDEVELFLASRARDLDMPMLGICRGVQIMNVAAGGTLIEDIPTQCGETIQHQTPACEPRDTLAHRVWLSGDGLVRLVGCQGLRLGHTQVAVNSTHHQAAHQVGAGYEVAARADDGIIEALISADGRFQVGVQWHPEELLQDGHDGLHLALFTGLVRAAARRREA